MLKSVSRFFEFALGLFFLVSTAAKVVNIEAFAASISTYGVVKDPTLIQLSAYATLIAESFVAAAFLSGRFLAGAAYIVAIGMLAVFTGLTAYAWVYLGIEDCGCFGEFLKTPPMWATIRNLVLIVLTSFTWYGVRPDRGAHPIQHPVWRTGVAVLSLLVVVTLGLTQNNSAVEVAPRATPTEPVEADAPFAAYVFETEAEPVNLGQGEWLVAMLSATCEHCMDSVEGLNALHEAAEVPEVVGLMLGESRDIDDFRALTEPKFKLFGIPSLEFMQYILTAPPRLLHISEGRLGASWEWEAEPPDVATIQSDIAVQ